jgi:ABC-type branched-subunit amino acid transport system ATPase component
VRDAMLRPKLLMLDEPSFGLARSSMQEMFPILVTCQAPLHSSAKGNDVKA